MGSARKKEKTLLKYLERSARKGDLEEYREWRSVAVAAGLKGDVERCDEIMKERMECQNR